MSNIQIYGNSYTLKDGEGVYITGADISQIVQEMYAEDVLDALDYSDIMDYIFNKEQEGEE